MADSDGWIRIGQQVLYLFADDREHGKPAHGGRGVLTWYGPDGKQSWAPPEDDFRLIWDSESEVWGLWVREGSESAARYSP